MAANPEIHSRAEPPQHRDLEPVRKRSPRARLLGSTVLRGCNVHHRLTVIRQVVRPGPLAGLTTAAAGPGFAAKFLSWVDGLGGPAGQRMTPAFRAALGSNGGVPLDACWFEATLAVEMSVRHAMRRLSGLEFAAMGAGDAPGTVEFVWDTSQPGLSRQAARAALTGLAELLPTELRAGCRLPDRSCTEQLAKLTARALRRRWSTATAVLALAARRRGLPVELLGDAYLRVGQGAMQHILYASGAGLPTGQERPDEHAGDEFLGRMYPDGTAVELAAAVVAGGRGAGAVCRDLEGILRVSGRSVGLCIRPETTVAGEPIDPGSSGIRSGLRYLLNDPRVDTLVTGMSPRRIVRQGLVLNGCTAAAVLDPAAKDDGNTFRRAMEVLQRANSGPIVIGAGAGDDPGQGLSGIVAAAADPGKVILVAQGTGRSRVRRHLAAGGRAFVQAGRAPAKRIELRDGDGVLLSLPLPAIGLDGRGHDGPRALRLMYAMGLALALGLSPAEIEAAVLRRVFLRQSGSPGGPTPKDA